jgi:hypothetical protein
MRPKTSTRQLVLPLLVLCLTVFAVPITGAAPNGSGNTSTERDVNESASKAKAPSNTHTLVIKATGKPVTYTVSASKKIRISSNKNESIDSVQGTSATGHVGKKRGKNKSKDNTDVVTYRGYIESFQAQGNNVRVFLDGKRVPPSVLAANHIRISSPKKESKKKSQPTKYKISVSGRAIPGESTNKKDTTKNGTIRGQITRNSDSFYFTGKLTSFSGSEKAIFFINGQKYSGDENTVSQPSTPTSTSSQTAPSTGAPETATDSQSMPALPTVTDSITANASDGDPSSNGGSGSSSGSGFIYGLVGGVVAIGLAVCGTILYFRPRKRRW